MYTQLAMLLCCIATVLHVGLGPLQSAAGGGILWNLIAAFLNMTNIVLILAIIVSLHRLTLITGKPTTNNLTIHPDPTTASGTDVTLTIDVKPSGGGVESNYIVLRLSVVEPVSAHLLASPWRTDWWSLTRQLQMVFNNLHACFLSRSQIL